MLYIAFKYKDGTAPRPTFYQHGETVGREARRHEREGHFFYQICCFFNRSSQLPFRSFQSPQPTGTDRRTGGILARQSLFLSNRHLGQTLARALRSNWLPILPSSVTLHLGLSSPREREARPASTSILPELDGAGRRPPPPSSHSGRVRVWLSPAGTTQMRPSSSSSLTYYFRNQRINTTAKPDELQRRAELGWLFSR